MTNEEKAEMEARVKLDSANGGIPRSETEIKKSVELQSLFDDWKAQVSTKPPIVFQDDGKAYPPQDYFAADGFFPGYFEQKTKVLFIGRETRWISGSDFRDTSYNFFKNENVNGSAFWCKVLYMLYGIQHEGKIPYAEVPYANEIAKKMVETGNFGFAVMQLSKYSNDSDEGGTRNIELMNRFLADSELEKRNFFQEELELLEPDIIITANLWECGVNDEYLGQCFPGKWTDELSPIPKIANHWKYDLAGRQVDVINTYHFSAPKKAAEEFFYEPVMKILFPNAQR